MRCVSPLDALLGDIFVGVTGIVPSLTVQLKIEGFNMAGSIKLKPAIQMVEDLEYRGLLRPGKRVVESSSGNLGVALSLVCLVKGYAFTCVSDPNISDQNRRLIEAYGGRIVIVTQRDTNGGFLNTRIALIEDMLAADPDLLWVNQYANPANKAAHIRWTAPEILRAFPNLEFLFVGAGTTGTLMGCAEYIRRAAPWVKIVAVDTEGSVTFGFPPGKRYIPGLGTSRVPELADRSLIDDIVMVPEAETIDLCRWLVRDQGWLVGGSTGTVLAGIRRWSNRIRPGSTVVAISPDFGERYLDLIYNDEWVESHFAQAGATEARRTVAATA
jgi:2,3-diaminopropionate biosynthesis protein SbnA